MPPLGSSGLLRHGSRFPLLKIFLSTACWCVRENLANLFHCLSHFLPRQCWWVKSCQRFMIRLEPGRVFFAWTPLAWCILPAWCVVSLTEGTRLLQPYYSNSRAACSPAPLHPPIAFWKTRVVGCLEALWLYVGPSSVFVLFEKPSRGGGYLRCPDPFLDAILFRLSSA